MGKADLRKTLVVYKRCSSPVTLSSEPKQCQPEKRKKIIAENTAQLKNVEKYGINEMGNIDKQKDIKIPLTHHSQIIQTPSS